MSDIKNNIDFHELPNAHNFMNLSGQRYGRLLVLGYAGRHNKAHKWFCQCDCGNTTVVFLANLRKPNGTQSCGCLGRETTSINKRRHGELKGNIPTPEYLAYKMAKARCNNPKNKAYKWYGARGIEFRFNSVVEFLAAVGRRPSSKHSLDRIDNNGHYEKTNIHWVTIKHQQRNRRSNRPMTINGKTRLLIEWAEFVNKPMSVIHQRLKNQWCAECAVFQPLNSHCVHKT